MSGKAGQGLRAVLLAAAVACLVPNVTAYAIEGWNKVGDEWQYLNREDQPVTNAFKKSKEDWFYLDESGTLLKSYRTKRVGKKPRNASRMICSPYGRHRKYPKSII